MAPIKGEKTALQRLAEEHENRSRDFDPEDFGDGGASDSEAAASEVSEDDATAHYEQVGKSRLRKPHDAELGPQYAGSKVSRDALNDSGADDDDDDDDDLDEEDLDGISEGSDEDDLDDGLDQLADGLSDDGSEEDEDGFGADDDSENADLESATTDDEDEVTPKITSKTSEFLAMAQQGQETGIRNLAQAAQTDVEKGNAVKKQRSVFNALLNCRMRLQKGLVAANTLSTVSNTEISSEDDREVIEAAEKAAISLLNSISSLRSSLPTSNGSEARGTKRPFSATIDTLTDEIHKNVQSLEASVAPARKAILTRWGQKTQPSAPKTKSKLRDAPVQQSLASLLDSQLTAASLTRLVGRTRIPRSCAPVQAEKSKDEDAKVYDDADWYALLLRDLVESKMSESGADVGTNGTKIAAPTAASADALRRQAKTHRANVDVKASKGRKLRYTVQEKIQNFMAPEDRTTWNERQVTELFGSLLGKRIAGGLEEDEGGEEGADDMDVDVEAEPLRLFATAGPGSARVL